MSSLVSSEGLGLDAVSEGELLTAIKGGVPNEKIIEALGTFKEAYCQACKAQYDLKWLKDEIFKPETNDGVPKCTSCKTGVVRPNIVFFGESLPNR